MAFQKISAPFDIKKFTKENGELISKYMKKDTRELVVDDFEDVPDSAFYKGNSNIISGSVDRSSWYTLMQKLEYYKCAKDIVYFCEKYVKIISIDDGIIPFKPWGFQKKLLRMYMDNRFCIAMQCRQSGKSQTTATYILHYSSFNEAKTSAILAQNVSQAQEILERAQMSYENLPKFLQAGVLVYNKRSMKLRNSSVIFSAASTSTAVRGKSCVSGDTKVTVKDINTETVQNITIKKLTQLLTKETSKDNQTYYKNKQFKCLTPSGWSNFKGVLINHNQPTIKLNNIPLVCTNNHKLVINGNLVKAKTLPHIPSARQDVYDLYEVENNHLYYTNGVVSHNCSLVYIDEGAFIPRDQEFYTGTYPVISSGKQSKIIITSTPNGKRGLFYKLWSEAEALKNEFKFAKVTWKDVPGRDLAWKKQTIANSSASQFAQEHEVIFAGAQNSLISAPDLEDMVVQPIIAQYGDVNVYEQPVREVTPHVYVLVCDVSRGLGNDYSAFTVMDVSVKPYKQVATYRNNTISPILLTNIIHSTAVHYNNAFVLIELNDIGEQTASILKEEYEYENQLTTVKEKNSSVIGFGADAQPGVRTTTKVKSIGVSTLQTLVSNKLIDICDNTTIAELGTFVPKGASYAADGDAHDDTVMVLVLFAWLTTQAVFTDISKTNIRSTLLNSLSDRVMQDIMPFGIISNDVGGFDCSTISIMNECYVDPNDDLYYEEMCKELLL